MGNKDNILVESIKTGDTSTAIKLLNKNKKSSKIVVFYSFNLFNPGDLFVEIKKKIISSYFTSFFFFLNIFVSKQKGSLSIDTTQLKSKFKLIFTLISRVVAYSLRVLCLLCIKLVFKFCLENSV